MRTFLRARTRGSDVTDDREGRLSNVSGVVIIAAGDSDARVAEMQRLLERACEEVVVQQAGSSESPLAVLLAALERSQAERVLVVEAAEPLPTAELVLALVAWPERPVVHPTGSWSCAIYRRSAALPAARACLAEGETAVASLAAKVEASEIGGHDLAAINEAG